jgi:hypothetical protein
MVAVLGEHMETDFVCLDSRADPDGKTSEGMQVMLIASYFKRVSMMSLVPCRAV